MSKKRKKTGGNPANRHRHTADCSHSNPAYDEFVAMLAQMADDALADSGNALIEAGATWEQVEAHRRAMRCKIAAEGMEAGSVEIFEWVMGPILNEIEFMKIIEKAEEMGMERPLSAEDEEEA